MSIFNESNNLASELVFGRYYQSNEPCPQPERLVFVKGDSTAVVTALEKSEQEWACVASIIHRLFNVGYHLGCDMNVSWNGRYDADGDPMPGKEYRPCGEQVSGTVGDRSYCLMHLEAAGGKPEDIVTHTCNVEEL